MRIAFIRRRDGDWIHVVRDDGTEARWRPPAGPEIPHDLLHFLVEADLGMQHGFWGLVDQGVDFEALNAKTKDPPAAGLSSEVTELLWSEAITGALMLGLMAPDLDEAACLEHAARNCERWSIPPPEVGPEDLARLRGSLAELVGEWRALGDDGTLVREFPPGPS